jgi:predicted Zn finger-like uncharacterized protein
MRVICDSCGASYNIADAKVLGRLVKVRCKSCSGTILVDGRGPRAAAPETPPTSLRSTSARPPAPVAPPLPPTSSIPPAIMPRAPSAPPPAAQPAPGAAWQATPSEPPDDATQLWNRAGASPLAAGGTEAESWSVNLSDTDQRTMSSEQIIEGFLSGEVTDDAFVWKEGMDDWMPVLEVDELRTAIEQRQMPRSQHPLPAFNFSPGPAAVAQPAPGAQPLAARVTGAIDHSADLFGGVALAGSEADAMEPPEPAPMAAEARMIGARNENSVLFSLDALKAGVSLPGVGPAAAPRATPAPPVPGSLGYGAASAPVEDILGFGSSSAASQLFSSEANQALLTAPAPEPEPPKPKPRAVEAMLSQPPPYPAEKRIGVGVWIALGGLAVMLVAGALFGGLMLGRMAATPREPVAQASDSKPTPDDSKQAQASSPSDRGKEQKPDEKREDRKAQEQQPAEQQPAKQPVSEEDRKRYEEAQKAAKADKKTADQKTETKQPKAEEKKTEEPGSGGTPFNKGAAIAALSSAASACSGCKRPDGPTGPGKVTVTFAPSGRVTSALITGGSYGGTAVGGCVASVFRRAKVPPFDGGPVTVAKSFHIPP